MNKPQRAFLKGLADQISDKYIEQFGKPMIYIAVEKRAVPKPTREGGYDVTAEKVKHEVNHFRRMKREFIKNGVEGVSHYLKNCGFVPDNELLSRALS